MHKKNPKNLCLYCFSELDFRRVCKNCDKEDDKTPSPPHHLPKRTVLNKKYVIARSIGEGGFGVTYLAYDLIFNRPVAVKEYYPSGYVSRAPRTNDVILNLRENAPQFNNGLRRFIDEAKNLSSINKLDGIVSVLDFFPANSTAYLVMEYLDGISLKRYIQKKGKLDTETALTILHPVISSLGAVHDVGLIHRDISPDNILITRNSEVKLIDFGASKTAGEDNKSMSIVLKQGFAPEEQYRTHGVQGPWSDIYALAVTIYFCITGQLPPESIQRLYEDTLTPPSKLGSDINAKQEKALLKALAVLAKDRYKNMRDFERDLYGYPSRTSNADSKQTAQNSHTKHTVSDHAVQGVEYKPRTQKTEKSSAKIERMQGAKCGSEIEKHVQPSPRKPLTQELVKDGNPNNVRTKKVQRDEIRTIKRMIKEEQPTKEDVTVAESKKPSLLSKIFNTNKNDNE